MAVASSRTDQNLMSVSEIHEPTNAADRRAGSVIHRAIDVVRHSRIASARGRFTMAACCLTFLTYLLLSEDPWWLFRAFPKDATRALKHGVIDKVYHFIAYFGTTCMLMWYAASGSRRTMYGLAGAVTVHAVVTEFLQQFVPRRTTDMADLIANLAGIAAGLCFGILLRRMLDGSKSRTPATDNQSETSPVSPSETSPVSVLRVSTRQSIMPGAASVEVHTNPSRTAVSAERTRFERLQLSSDQIAEVQPRQIDYRLLGIVAGVLGLMLASTYAVHGWQVSRISGSMLQNARAALAAGDSDAAISCFEQYCNSTPNDVNALAEFAILSDDVRVPPQGGRGVFLLFERVLRKDQTRDDVRRRVVATALELGRYSDALAHAKVLQQTFPKEGAFDFQAGICHENLSNFNRAAEAFAAAIEDSPELIESWERLARLKHFRLNASDEAEQLMQRLVQANSQKAEAWIARARFLVEIKQAEAAGQDVERALDIAPNAFRVLHAAGEVGIARARQARAEDKLPKGKRIAIETGTLLSRNDQSKEEQRQLDLQRVVLEAEFGSVNRAFALATSLPGGPSSADHIRIHQLIAEIAITHGQIEQARRSLDQLPRTEITDGQRLRLEAAVAMSEERWNAAADILTDARRILAESLEQLQKVDLSLAECFGKVGRVEEQIVAYRQLLKYSPQSVEARRGLAFTLATAGRYPEALAEYRLLVHIPAVRLELVRHLIDYNGTMPEVARDWKEVTELLAIAKTDGDASVELGLLSAEVLIAKGDFDAARRLLMQTRNEYPDDPDLLAMQIRIAELSGDMAEASRLKGETIAATGKAEDAERQLRLMLLESDDNGKAAIALMELYLRNGQTDQAVDVFKQYAATMKPLELSRTYEAFGDLKRAVDILQQHVSQQPDDVEAAQNLAELFVRNGRPELAEPLLEKLISPQSNVSAEGVRSARRILAIILAKQQNHRVFQRATALMDQNAAENPVVEVRDVRTMATVLLNSPIPADHLVAIGLLEKIDDRRQMTNEDRWQLGKIYIRIGSPEQAGSQFEQAARSGFAEPRFLADWITHQIRMGDLAEAREQIERLPANVLAADVARLRSRYLVAAGRSDAAVSELDNFVDTTADPKSRIDHFLLAADECRAALLHDPSANEAILSQAADRYLRTAVQEDAKQVQHLVRWLLERRRDVEAFDLLDVVWQELPSENAASLSLEMLHSGSNRSRRELVEQYLVAKNQEQPALLELKLVLADVWSLGAKYAEADELYREILREDSRHVTALNSLAWNLAMRGRLLDEAMTFAERAIAEAGPMPRLLDTRGCVKLAQSRLRAATDDLIEAVEGGNLPETFLHLAFVQAESGDTDSARQTLARAVEVGLRAEQLHPLDRDLLNRLNAQLQSGRDAGGRADFET
jgi:tetratricopeptide (TPR) repeat protein/VanZ family protein